MRFLTVRNYLLRHTKNSYLQISNLETTFSKNFISIELWLKIYRSRENGCCKGSDVFWLQSPKSHSLFFLYTPLHTPFYLSISHQILHRVGTPSNPSSTNSTPTSTIAPLVVSEPSGSPSLPLRCIVCFSQCVCDGNVISDAKCRNLSHHHLRSHQNQPPRARHHHLHDIIAPKSKFTM